MTEEITKHTVNRMDFGVNMSSSPSSKGKNQISIKTPIKISPSSKSRSMSVFKSAYDKLKITFIKLKKLFKRLKWRFSRSIFFGRGIYFKYILSSSVVISMVLVSLFYLSSNSSFLENNTFFSKWSVSAEYSEGNLTRKGTQTILTSVAKPIKYQVQPGDTLEGIASQFRSQGYSISVDSIRWANNMKKDDLTAGTWLDVPPVDGTLHIVQRGETLDSIGRKYERITDATSEIEKQGVYQEIADVNALEVRVEGEKKVPVIVEGQRLIIPGGIIKPEPTPTPVPVYVASNPEPVYSEPAAYEVIYNEPAAGMTLPWPVAGGYGYISQYYRGYAHPAVDIARTNLNDSYPLLVSVGEGTISYIGWENGGGGNVVWVDYDNGFRAQYAHMDSFALTPDGSRELQAGDRVSTGQVVGVMGQTGRAFGVHVHFSLYFYGQSVDPLDYIGR